MAKRKSANELPKQVSCMKCDGTGLVPAECPLTAEAIKLAEMFKVEICPSCGGCGKVILVSRSRKAPLQFKIA